MAKENVQVVATAKDHASPTLKKLQANVTSLGSKGRGPIGGLLSGLGGISPAAMVGAVGIGVMTAALADGVAGALEEEKQLARLDQALATNVKGWDGNREAIDRATDAAMDLAFSDDEARESMIRLVTATGDVNKSLDYTRLAMDIARGRNIDLATATDIVIKANMGNVGALRRMGIELDKDATKTEILTTLQERYAGQAAAYADTTAGRFEAAQKKVDNFLESIGHAFINVTAGTPSPNTFDPFLVQYDLGLARAIADGMPNTKDAMGRSMGDIWAEAAEAGAAEARPQVQDALARMFRIEQNRIGLADQVREMLSDDIVGTLRGGGIRDIMKDLNWAINHPEKLAKFGEKLQEALNNPKLKALLESDNPFLQLVGMQTQQKLTDLWKNITGGADTSASAVDALAASIRRLTGALSNVPGGAIRDLWVDSVRPGETGARAAGGPVEAGQTYVVGEKGPELLHMGNGSGSITPNHQLGGVPPHSHPIYIRGREVFRAMNEEMGREIARTPAGAVNRG